MPIHHDKGVYGRLEKTNADLSEEELIALAKRLQNKKNPSKTTRKDGKEEKQPEEQ